MDIITPQEARDQAKDILAEAYKGNDPGAAPAIKANELTFGSFIDDVYGSWIAANVHTHKATLRRLNQCFEDFRLTQA